MNDRRKEREKTFKKKNVLQHLVTIIAATVFIYSFYKLVPIVYDYYKNRQVLHAAQALYDEGMKEPVSLLNQSDTVRSSFQSLLNVNDDIIGWITLNDTNIHYPILQGEDNDYYLTRNYKKQETRAGSIFLDYRNDKKLGNNKNSILYGHRMKDGTMFAHLKKYLDKDFFNKHQKIYVDSLYEGYDLEVFSVYQTTTSFYYIETDFLTGRDYVAFVQQLKEKSIYSVDVEIGEEDSIVTLSTCDYSVDSLQGRLVVHAKLIRREGGA